VIRLRVTDLETYRYWRASEDSTVGELLARLAHTEPPTPAMEAGRAFAGVFEHARLGEVEEVESDGWRFSFDLDAAIELAPVRELRAESVLSTPAGPVTLVGQVDGLDGVAVYDQKLTERIDAEKYLDSLQWRAYLAMFGAERFCYDLFAARYDGHRVTVYDYQRLTFYAYPNMRRDVERAAGELAGVVAAYAGAREGAGVRP
jgi:hypothetical protein